MVSINILHRVCGTDFSSKNLPKVLREKVTDDIRIGKGFQNIIFIRSGMGNTFIVPT